jgi:DNA-binding transcriptional LysR family regulator
MALDLDALRVFVKVAELASFTQAAQQLGMPKARASLRVQALENELGVRLLQRTTRMVRPTSDGAQLLPRAKQLVLEADELGAMFQGSRALRGVVRIDLPINFARDVIIPKLPELLAAHPQLTVEVSTTDHRVEVVREGFDCVLSIGTLRPSGLIAQRLGQLAVANCASPAYVKKYGLPRELADLDRHLLIHYEMALGTESPTFEYPEGDGYAQYPMRSIVTVNSADAYRAACIAGLGIVQLPRLGVRHLIDDGLLVEVLPDLPCAPMPVSLVHPHGRNVPRRVRAVMQWIASVIAPRLDT